MRLSIDSLRGFFENTIVVSTITFVASAALRCVEQTGGPTSYFFTIYTKTEG